MSENTREPFAGILSAMAQVREANYEPKHLKVSHATWDAAIARIGAKDHGLATTLYGLPVFIDDDLPRGRWEVGAGRRPEPDTEYETAIEEPTP